MRGQLQRQKGKVSSSKRHRIAEAIGTLKRLADLSAIRTEGNYETMDAVVALIWVSVAL
jgi:hypothetical protein